MQNTITPVCLETDGWTAARANQVVRAGTSGTAADDDKRLHRGTVGMHRLSQPSPNCQRQLFVFPSFILLHKSGGAFVLRHLFVGKLSSGGTFQSGIKTTFSPPKCSVYVFKDVLMLHFYE